MMTQIHNECSVYRFIFKWLRSPGETFPAALTDIRFTHRAVVRPHMVRHPVLAFEAQPAHRTRERFLARMWQFVPVEVVDVSEDLPAQITRDVSSRPLAFTVVHGQSVFLKPRLGMRDHRRAVHSDQLRSGAHAAGERPVLRLVVSQLDVVGEHLTTNPARENPLVFVLNSAVVVSDRLCCGLYFGSPSASLGAVAIEVAAGKLQRGNR